MRTHEDIENFLYELEFPFEKLEEGFWRVSDENDGIENLVLYVTGTVLNLRLKLFELPGSDHSSLFRKLLELNASEMVHGSYGIEGNSVVVSGALEVENLDRNELQASVEAIGLAIRDHHAMLTPFLK